MTGYCNSQNYFGVIGLSFFLKSVFERAKEVKFLIVLNEHMLFQTSGKDIITTLRIFLDTFKLEALRPDIKDIFYSSISLVITRAKFSHLHSTFLERIL